VQLDPIKPKLKAPGIQRLKLTNDKLLSNVGFKIDLRCYMKAGAVDDVVVEDDAAFDVLMYSGRDAVTQAVGVTAPNTRSP